MNRTFTVRRISPPAIREISDAAARQQFGEQAEWGYAIPSVFQALAAPQAGCAVARAPRAGDDIVPVATGYWAALLHLLVYRLGWSRPDLGLRWWYDVGHRSGDPVLSLVSEVWGRDGQLDAFAAWLWTTNMRPMLPQDEPSWGEPPKTDVDWLAAVKDRMARQAIPSPYGGGYDRLHLLDHVGGPLKQRAVTEPLAIAGDRTALLLDGMEGWYGALLGVVDSSSGRYSTDRPEVDVIVREVGWLGTYRYAAVTGLWHACTLEVHLAGSPIPR